MTKTKFTKQFKGESSPRSLYRHSCTGLAQTLEGYAFSVRQAFEESGFVFTHKVISETETEIRSEYKGLNFLTAKVEAV